MYKICLRLLLIIFISSHLASQAQPSRQKNGAEILLDLKKLNTLGSALYIAAHPDDENTRLITFLSREKLWQTSYLSLTRGDGGQNLIGSEQGDALGIIRTQELLEARKIDGGTQYFASARDFGFSKTPAETFTKWDKDKLLSETVWMIRQLKPDIIITRFSPEAGKTHGHHTASAMLAVEAFDAAADKTKFPDQLKHTQIWQAKRIIWNSSKFFYGTQEELDAKKPNSLDVGLYNPTLGKSYGEIAAESRSMHKSQGFGSAGVREPSLEYFEFLKGEKITLNIFDDINSGWGRVKGGPAVEQILTKAIEAFNPSDPSTIVPLLMDAYQAIQQTESPHWKTVKTTQLKDLIKQCLGLYLEASASTWSFAPGEKIQVSIEVFNRTGKSVILKNVKLTSVLKDTLIDKSLSYSGVTFTTSCNIPENINTSQPYWLKKSGTEGMFDIQNISMIGQAENDPILQATFNLQIEGSDFSYTIPVFYKITDPVKGEYYKPLQCIPPVEINVPQNVHLFTGQASRPIQLVVKAGKDDLQGTLVLSLPKGWKSQPESAPFELKTKGEEKTFSFSISPPEKSTEEFIRVFAKVGGQEYSQGNIALTHDHILPQVFFPDAIIKVVKLDLNKKGTNIAYLMGAGDNIPSILEQVGYKVTLLKDEEVSLINLKIFDAVIVGVRAYNTNAQMKFHQEKLFEYVRDGGTMIVQYQTANRLLADSIAPYRLKISSDRVTVEDAPVQFLNPAHPILNTPNKITEKDFTGWKQERGLYFAAEWDKEFEPLLSSNDPGEAPKKGGLLVAKYGRGHYIFTGYSWFREVPAGIPGALRIFVNLISAGK